MNQVSIFSFDDHGHHIRRKSYKRYDVKYVKRNHKISSVWMICNGMSVTCVNKSTSRKDWLMLLSISMSLIISSSHTLRTSLGTMNSSSNMVLYHPTQNLQKNGSGRWGYLFLIVWKLPWCKSNRKFMGNPQEEIKKMLSIKTWTIEASHYWNVGISVTRDLYIWYTNTVLLKWVPKYFFLIKIDIFVFFFTRYNNLKIYKISHFKENLVC